MIALTILCGAGIIAAIVGLCLQHGEYRAAELRHARARDEEIQTLKAMATDLEERKRLRLTLMARTLEGPRARKDWLN